jgi:hypothetical protein
MAALTPTQTFADFAGPKGDCYVEGENVAIDTAGPNQIDRLPELAAGGSRRVAAIKAQVPPRPPRSGGNRDDPHRGGEQLIARCSTRLRDCSPVAVPRLSLPLPRTRTRM